jgi:hypothetical protein
MNYLSKGRFLCSGLVGALAAAALALPAAAQATPTVQFKAKIVPIPGFPHTGNILGAGADLETEFFIHGTEYDYGHPLPLRRVEVYFPKGTKIDTAPFPSACTPAELKSRGPAACKKEKAGPPGLAEGVVNIGGEPIHENTTIYPTFTKGGLLFFIEGSDPAKIEQVAVGHWVYNTAPPYGPKIVVEVPLIETLPGAPFASAEYTKVKSGAAIRKGHKVIYYGRVPLSCPKGGFPAKAVLYFGTGNSPSEWSSATAFAKVPCPPAKKGKKRRARMRHATNMGHHAGATKGRKRRVRRHKVTKKHVGKAKGHAKHHGKGKAKGHSKEKVTSLY